MFVQDRNIWRGNLGPENTSISFELRWQGIGLAKHVRMISILYDKRIYAEGCLLWLSDS